jgi:hypothetical protein
MMIIWINTYYKVKEKQELKIVSSPIKYPIIIIQTIKKVEKSKSILSSPTLSMVHIKISYEHSNHINISSKDKNEFTETFKGLNPYIELNI